MRGHGIDIGGSNIGLDFISLGASWRTRMIDGIHDREQLGGFVTITEHREGEHRPDRGMGILAAVLANAGRISLDVSGFEWRLIKRRGKEQDEPIVAAYEIFIYCGHSARSATRIGG